MHGRTPLAFWDSVPQGVLMDKTDRKSGKRSVSHESFGNTEFECLLLVRLRGSGRNATRRVPRSAFPVLGAKLGRLVALGCQP